MLLQLCSGNLSLAVAGVAASLGLEQALTPPAEYFASLNLPNALVKWGHPGNMAVVLLAMGGYGSGWLGWQIRLGGSAEAKRAARSLHPKLAIGMTVFFALGAVGGMMSLIMQGQHIFSSSHVWTGLTGIVLLLVQGMLSLFFKEDPGARTTHAFLGTAILALFFVHAFIGLRLGLSLSV